MESFLEAQQKMFDFFGGVPSRLIFDNAKVAVKEGFGKHAKATDGYKAFAAHYAFKTEFCNIASGNEKGLVENLVGFARKNFMVPVPRVKSIDELNAQLLASCTDYMNTHKVTTKSVSVKEAYEVER
jgi:transposase